MDEAVGEVAEIFSRGDLPSNINRDGTVNEAPEIDSVTEYATEGEKRLHYGLMIAMIVVGQQLEQSLVPLHIVTQFSNRIICNGRLWNVVGETWIPSGVCICLE